MCRNTCRLCADTVEVSEIDTIAVVGKREGIRIYELLACKGELAPEMAETRKAYERGLAAYRERPGDASRLAFEQRPEARPGDPPAQVFLERLAELRLSPPDPQCDGVRQMASK